MVVGLSIVEVMSSEEYMIYDISNDHVVNDDSRLASPNSLPFVFDPSYMRHVDIGKHKATNPIIIRTLSGRKQFRQFTGVISYGLLYW